MSSTIMNAILASIIWFLPVAADDKHVSRVPLGKDTTYVNGPIDKNGFIDYEAAINELMSKGVKPETNANVLLLKAFGPRPEGGKLPAEYFKQLGINEPPEKGDYLTWPHVYLRDHLKLNPSDYKEILDQEERSMRRPWKAVDLPHITAWLALNEKPLAVVLEATKRPHYFNPLVSTKTDEEPSRLLGALLSSVAKCRALVSLLTARAMQRLGDGKIDEAWQDLLACHRLARHVARGACLTEALVGFAIDAIASNADLAFLESGKLSAKQMHNCLKDLQDLPPWPPMADKIDLCERFIYLDCLQLLRSGGAKTVAGLAREALPLPKDPEIALVLIDWTPVMRNGNHWHDRIAKALRQMDRADRERQLNRIDDELKALKNDGAKLIRLLGQGPPNEAVGKAIGDFLVGSLMPAANKLQNASDRCEQTQRNLHVAFALAAFHRDNKQYPDKLDELAPKYLATVPGDIFSGKALIYRPAEKGYLFYSVGVNGKDEEGRRIDDNPPGDDLRVIMPLPELKIRR
jgi:hypothetical protein